MNWYIAKIVYNIISKGHENSSQFDVQIRLVQSENLESAFVNAEVIGRNEEKETRTKNNNAVWKFINVSDLSPITEFSNGVELCSSVHEAEERLEYINLVHYKSEKIRSEFLQMMI